MENQEPSAAAVARLKKALENLSSAKVVDLHVRNVSPLDMSVCVDTELGAYRLAYYYRNSVNSKIKIEPAPNVRAHTVVIQPR